MDDHYFSADPAVAFKRAPVRATVWGHDLVLTSGSGVFAQGRLDVGTAVLFRETEPPAGGTLLDLGCGYGVIGCALASAAPTARVWGVDVNERAVLLANENAAALGVSHRYVASTPGGVAPEATYDELWSNPPIRVGKNELHGLLTKWLPRLEVGSDAWLVVQKNLGADSLQKWMNSELGDVVDVTRASTSKGYRVLTAHRR